LSFKDARHGNFSIDLREVASILELVPTGFAGQIEVVQRQIQATDVVVTKGTTVPHIHVQQILLTLQVEDISLVECWILMSTLHNLGLELLILVARDIHDDIGIHLANKLGTLESTT